MKPVCVPCERFMRCKKNGFNFTEGMPTENGVKPGKAEPEKWEPYKLWSGDLYECPDCGATVISGFARQPHAIQHEAQFESLRLRLGCDQLLVKDC